MQNEASKLDQEGRAESCCPNGLMLQPTPSDHRWLEMQTATNLRAHSPCEARANCLRGETPSGGKPRRATLRCSPSPAHVDASRKRRS